MTNTEESWSKHKIAAEEALGQGRLDLAETQWLVALRLAEDFEKTDKRYAFTLEKLAELYFRLGNLDKAHLYCEQVLGVYLDLFGPRHMDVACIAGNLAMICHALKNYRKAEKFYLQALDVKTELLGSDHQEVTKLRSNYADLLRMTNRKSEAEKLKTGASLVTATGWKKSTGSFKKYDDKQYDRKKNKNGDSLESSKDEEQKEKQSTTITPVTAKEITTPKVTIKPVRQEPEEDQATKTQDNIPVVPIEARLHHRATDRSGAPIGNIQFQKASSTQQNLPAAHTTAKPGNTQAAVSKSSKKKPPPPPSSGDAKKNAPPPLPKRKKPKETQDKIEAPSTKAEKGGKNKLPTAPGHVTQQNLPAMDLNSESLYAKPQDSNGVSLSKKNIPASPASITHESLPSQSVEAKQNDSGQNQKKSTSRDTATGMIPPGVAGKIKPGQTQQELADQWNSLKNSAEQALTKGDLKSCESLWHDAMEIAGVFGPNDPKLSYTLESLANVKFQLENYKVAENYYLRAYEIKLKVLGPNHIAIAGSANNLARLYYHLCEYTKAEKYSLMCIGVYETLMGPDNQNVATSLHNLATLYHVQRKYPEAEPVYKRSLEIKKKILGPDHPETVKLLKSYADLLRSTNRELEADELSSAAIGLISGTWKTFNIKDSSTLASTEDRCDICAAKLDGASKCPGCGFEVSIGVI